MVHMISMLILFCFKNYSTYSRLSIIDILLLIMRLMHNYAIYLFRIKTRASEFYTKSDWIVITLSPGDYTF